jgi:D-alanyl-D-alanine carboxypeptidase
MIDLAPALTEIVNRPAEGRGAAGIAALVAGADEPVAVWTLSSREEPAYLAYSITKTFTAVLFLLLQDEGRLALDDRLARWFSGIPGADRISLRRLLNHTAGVPDYGGLPSYHDAARTFPSTPWSFEQVAAETFDKGLSFEPGTGWEYSNPGYMLLKRVAEEVAGAPYATLIAQRITGPLGLRRTFVADSLEALSSLAPASSRELTVDRSPCDVRGRYHPGWVSHGVVASTPSDVARFFDAVFRRRHVSPRSLREMRTLVPVAGAPPMPSPRWSRPGYGFGIVGIQESPFGPLWGHNGGGPGYRASAYHAPDLGEASVCAMCSLEGDPGAEPLVFAVFAALRGQDCTG